MFWRDGIGGQLNFIERKSQNNPSQILCMIHLNSACMGTNPWYLGRKIQYDMIDWENGIVCVCELQIDDNFVFN